MKELENLIKEQTDFILREMLVLGLLEMYYDRLKNPTEIVEGFKLNRNGEMELMLGTELCKRYEIEKYKSNPEHLLECFVEFAYDIENGISDRQKKKKFYIGIKNRGGIYDGFGLVKKDERISVEEAITFVKNWKC